MLNLFERIVQPLSKPFVQYLQTQLYRLYRLYELAGSYNIVRIVQHFVQYCNGLVCRCAVSVQVVTQKVIGLARIVHCSW